MRLKIILAKYGSVTVYSEHGQSVEGSVYGDYVDQGINLGVTDEEREENEMVGGNIGGSISEGGAGCSYVVNEGQNSILKSGPSSLSRLGSGLGEHHKQPASEEFPCPQSATEVPVTEEHRSGVDDVRVDEGATEVEVEEVITGEGATLYVEEDHFANSDSQNEEAEIARKVVRKWRKDRAEARRKRRAQLDDEEEQVNEVQEEPLRREEGNDEEQGGESDRDSVYHSSESDWSVISDGDDSDSEQDDAQRTSLPWPQYDPSQPFLDFSVKLGFAGPKEFKEALSRYAVKNQIDFKFTRNTRKKVSAECKGRAGEGGPRCGWRVYASWQTTDGVFRVKTYNNHHQCNPAYKNRRVTAAIIANQLKGMIDENPSLKAWQLQRLVKTHMKTEVRLSKCIQAKRLHYEETIRKEKEEFGKLWSYVAELRNSNPANSVFVQTQRDEISGGTQFKRMYVCLSACKEGMLGGCRKFIGIDGCFLKGIMKGELLTAIGMDANNQMFPVAWAVVEVENTHSWTWFLRLLGEELSMGEGDGWCVISDQQKGLMNAIHTILPNVQQRMCCRHIYANWRKKHRGKDLKRRFWACSKATYFEQFRRLAYDMALTMSGSAYEDLISLDPKHWARAMFPTTVKCENVDNNMCESFNATIIEARHKSIITLMEHMRLYVAKRMREKKISGENWVFEYGPRIKKRLAKSRELASEWNVQFKSDRGYEVMGFDGKKHVVKLGEQSCTCRIWDITGIPCAHAVCAIQYEGLDSGNYLNECYSKACYVKSYSYQLEPIRGEEFWPSVNLPPLLAPEIRSLPGKKKKKRRLEEHERNGKNNQSKLVHKPTRQMSCGWCEQLHHNKRGCPDRAYYLALEAAAKEKMVEQEVQDNMDDIPMSQGPTQEPEHPTGGEDTIHQQYTPEEPHQTSDAPHENPVESGSTTQQNIQKLAEFLRTVPVPNVGWTGDKKLKPSREFGMGLYQNSATGLAIIDPGRMTQRLVSAPVASGSDNTNNPIKRKTSKNKKMVASGSKN